MPKHKFSQLTTQGPYTQDEETLSDILTYDMPATKKSKKNSKKIASKPHKMYGTVSLSRETEFCFTKRICSKTTPIEVVPSAGFVVSGLSSSVTLGLFFDQAGFSIYNPAVGPGTIVNYTYGDYSSYAAIFDQFRIKMVKVSGWFSNNTSSIASTNSCIPVFYTAIDLDGGVSAPSSTSGSLLTYENGRVHQASTNGKPIFTRSLVPNFIVSTQSQSLSSKKQFINTNTTGSLLAWYGAFVQMDTFAAAQSTSLGELNLVCEITYAYKNVR